MITVTRWFGGTLLGTGGLVRAYTETAKAALAAAKTRERVPRLRFAARVPYPLVGAFLRLAKEASAQVDQPRFEGSSPVIEGLIPEEKARAFAAAAVELSCGAIEIELSAAPPNQS